MDDFQINAERVSRTFRTAAEIRAADDRQERRERRWSRALLASVAGVLCVVLLAVLVRDAQAQPTNQQLADRFGQLFDYTRSLAEATIKLRSRVEVLEAENEQQRAALNATIDFADDAKCTGLRVTQALKDYATVIPPIVPTFISNVDCRTLKAAPIPKPAALAPAVRPAP